MKIRSALASEPSPSTIDPLTDTLWMTFKRICQPNKIEYLTALEACFPCIIAVRILGLLAAKTIKLEQCLT